MREYSSPEKSDHSMYLFSCTVSRTIDFAVCFKIGDKDFRTNYASFRSDEEISYSLQCCLCHYLKNHVHTHKNDSRLPHTEIVLSVSLKLLYVNSELFLCPIVESFVAVCDVLFNLYAKFVCNFNE